MKRFFLFAFTVILLLALTACGIVEPGEVTFSSSTSSVPQETSSVPSEEESGAPESAETLSTPDAQKDVVTMYRDVDFETGEWFTATARLKEIARYDDWAAAGVDLAELADNDPIEVGGCILVATINLHNDNLTEESLEAVDFSVNGLVLADRENLEAFESGELCSFYEPVYFDSHRDSDVEYFHFDGVPAIGEETDIVMGWQLDREYTEKLENGELSMVCGWANVFSGAIPISVPEA